MNREALVERMARALAACGESGQEHPEHMSYWRELADRALRVVEEAKADHLCKVCGGLATYTVRDVGAFCRAHSPVDEYATRIAELERENERLRQEAEHHLAHYREYVCDYEGGPPRCREERARRDQRLTDLQAGLREICDDLSLLGLHTDEPGCVACQTKVRLRTLLER